jgi:hypothetical protein
MLKLVFAEAGPGPTLELEPLPSVRIAGEAMKAEPGGRVLARHRDHSWIVEGRKFFRVDCACPVRLHLENGKGDASPRTEPFMHFSFADGIAYGDGAIFATIDLETRRWFCHKDQHHWRELVVTSAAAPAG